LGRDIKEPMTAPPAPKDEVSSQVREKVKEVKEAQEGCWDVL